MDKSEAIRLVNALIEEADSVRRDGNYFDAWQRKCRTVLDRIFGTSSSQSQDLMNVDYNFYGNCDIGDDRPFIQAFDNGLQKSKEVLRSCIWEVETFGMPAVGPANTPRQAQEAAIEQSLATVFYSWQSDLPNSTNRGFIGDCLERAIKDLNADPDLKVDPCLDRDTQDVPGSPDIAATIFDKIDRCGLFVCDVSIVNQSTPGRPMPNPNVLIELGYAVKTLGWNRIVCIFNQATGTIQDLPFDLRQRRVRSYDLQEGHDKTDQRKSLTGLLKADLRHIFNAMLTRREVGEGTALGGADTHSIRFTVDDWTVWQEPAYNPDDCVVVISQWKAGDFLYSCTLRLRNELDSDDELHRLRMEFRQGDNVLLADTYAFADGGVALPSKKWVSINVSYGVHEDGVFAASDSVWFVADTVGDNTKVAWLVARLTHTNGERTERGP